MAKHTQTTRRQFTEELFECVGLFWWGWRLKGLQIHIQQEAAVS